MGVSEKLRGDETVPDLVRRQAELRAEKTALTFLSDGETEAGSLTYGELDSRARALAARLLNEVSPGSRACLFYPPGLDYTVALFGCLYAGVIAVPGYPPRSRRRLQRLEALIEDPADLIALTNESTRALMESALETAPEVFRQLRWIVTRPDDAAAPEGWREPQGDPDTIAIIQYTSGSTSTARGVMLTHRNLLHNVEQIRERFGVTADTRSVCWLPPYHDMGLIGGLIASVCAGAFCAQMSPAAFTQRPARWLEAISRYRASISGGPNSAYELCAQRISAEDRAKLDLSCWEVAFNGAEAVRAATLDRFEAAFAPHGFKRSAWLPCYGLAEATLMVTSRRRSGGVAVGHFGAAQLANHILAPDAAEDGSIALAGCGSVIDGTELRIVNPETMEICAPDCVGEICVAGPSVAQGYWNRGDETAGAFDTILPGESRRFLRTGDLGCVHRGELFVTGRIKDLIVIHGANHYPQEIEASVDAGHAALRAGCGAAFAVDGRESDELVVVQETTPRAEFVADEVFAKIRGAIADAHGIEVRALVLIKPGTILRTSSGKIRRQACRTAFLEGELEVVARWDTASAAADPLPTMAASVTPHSESEIREWLTHGIARRLGIDARTIEPHSAFINYGLESSDAVGLILELEAWLGRPVSPTAIWDFPSIDLLAGMLSEEPKSTVEPMAESRTDDRDEPIAVIGMACRFPGADNTDEFWRLLREGRSGISEAPGDRWDLAGWQGMEPGSTAGDAIRWGGFLENIDQFDPYFFGIAPREAISMDPQQRLLMEVAWEALEDAGVPPSSLAGGGTGVFIGISNMEYGRGRSYDALDFHSGTGNALSIAANRLSYFLDLKGPSLAVDTACSSSLTALHLACQSIRSGESLTAVAGGVNLLLSPDAGIVFEQANMLAPDGICKVFDAAADGYVRAEGCGVVILKGLAAAIRDGDRIAGVILATSVNQDGRTNGLTAPNGPSQQAVMQDALQRAGVTPVEVGYVEAHGTGTPLGDPIEVQALGAVFGAGGEKSGACCVGSLKANVGHLEPAAGIASLIKTLLMLRHEEMPPQINVRKFNPHLGLENTRLRIPLALQSWPRGKRRRVAGISSFGFGGTNASVIVCEAPAVRTPERALEPLPQICTLSARSENALRKMAALYAANLSGTNASLADFCYSANTGRNQFAHRAAWVVATKEALADELVRLSRGESAAGKEQHAPLLAALRDRYLQGEKIDWIDFYSRSGVVHARVPLPTYPFERERFWLAKTEVSSRATPPVADIGDDESQTRPLLGTRIQTAVPVFEGRLSIEALPYLNDHVVNGRVVFPAAGYLEMAIEAALEEIGGNSLELTDVAFSRAMFLADGNPRVTQLILTPGGDERSGLGFEIFSRPRDSSAQFDWVSHARGKIRARERESSVGKSVGKSAAMLEAARKRCTHSLDVSEAYARMAEEGLAYGPAFRGLTELWSGAGEAVGFVETPATLAAVAGDYGVHPAFMDACFHVLAAAFEAIPGTGLFLPVGVDSFRLHGASVARGWAHASVAAGVGAENLLGDIQVFNIDGQLIFEASGLRLQRTESRAKTAESRFSNADLTVKWDRCERTAGELRPGRWIVLADDAQGAALCAAIEETGRDCIAMSRGEGITAANTEGVGGIVFVASLQDRDAEKLCGNALQLVKALSQKSQAAIPRLWLVTQGARVLPPDQPTVVREQGIVQASLWGLGSVIALEFPALRCRRVDLDQTGDVIVELLRELACNDDENEIALRGNKRFAARLIARSENSRDRDGRGIPMSASWTLGSAMPGDLETLRLSPASRRAPGPDEIEIQVIAAGLNFSDVMKAMGLYPGATAANMVLGAECSGVVTRTGANVTEFAAGDEVMAIAPYCFAPFVCTAAALAVRKPAGLHFEEAAAAPVAFLTATYALDRLARLERGERILIHAGTGGVGLAAIQIAQRAGAVIFATAGNPEKRALLTSMNLAGVFDSRSLDFADEIRALTSGYGVDVVLNSLAGEALTRSLELLAPHGRFLEIGKSDIYRNRAMSLKPFQRAVSFFAIDLDRMFRDRIPEVQSLFAEIAESLASGALKPLPLRVFPIADAARAFRHMAQAKHIGKIVLCPPQRCKTETPLVRDDGAYLITGGTGALGLHAAAWLARMGARRIVLISRSGASATAETSIQELRNNGAEILVAKADVAQRDQLEAVIREIEKTGPLRGVIHAAGVIADAAFVNLTHEHFRNVFASKATGAMNLHELTLGSPLDFFILFSSLASVTGSPGQGNYAAANAMLDSLAHYRRASGLPAISINWGPWAQGGMAARGGPAKKSLTENLRALPPDEALERMEKLLGSHDNDAPAQVTIASADWVSLSRGTRLNPPSPLLAHFREAVIPVSSHMANGSNATSKPTSAKGLTRQLLIATASGERIGVLQIHIREQISRVSGMPVARIGMEQSLSEMGIDSLTSLELFSHLEQTLEATVPSSIMTADLNIATLALHLTKQLPVN